MATVGELHAKVDEVVAAVEAQFGAHNPEHVGAVRTFAQVVKDRIAHLFEAPRILPFSHLSADEQAETSPKLHVAAQVAEHAAAVAGPVVDSAAAAAPVEG